MSEKWKIGDKIEGRYEIHDIKRGGMGIVFLCYDHEEKMPIAIKTFQDKYLMDKESIDRFMWEAETWVRLEKHKNIVRAYYVLKISGRPYIFLEFVPGDKTYGSDLTGWIWHNALDLETILSFAIQFCLGMEHAEKKFKEMGKVFVHRDIKPGNIMVTQDKVVKITDFGLVKTFMGLKESINIGIVKDEATGAERYGFSMFGSICGTPPYMSPEQCRGDTEIDTRSDIYSFGCVLYEMLTGRPPFKCPTFDIYRVHHLKVEPRPPIELAPSSPEGLNAIVMRCLEKEAKNRHQDFKELREKLCEIYLRETGNNFKIEETQEELETEELVLKGISLIELNKFKEAIEYFEKILELDPTNVRSWVGKGVSLINLGLWRESITCLDKALELPSSKKVLILALNNKGIALDKLGKQQEALSYFNKVIDLNPKYAEAWYNKGLVLKKLGRIMEALTCFDKTLMIRPADALAWINKGYSLMDIGKHQEAIDAFESFIKFASIEHVEYIQGVNELLKKLKAKKWYEKAYTLANQGKYQEAIACFDEVLKIYPNLADAWYNKGVALFSRGEYEEAIICHDKALEINTEHVEAWVSKGAALGNLGKYQEAIACLDRALEINPKFALAWFNKGLVLHNLGKLQEAIEAFQNFIKFAPPEYAGHVAKIKETIRELEAQSEQKKSFWKRLFE
jgi:tetratricopeptide (TPR) repeat protein